jgi:hypothetical protein
LRNARFPAIVWASAVANYHGEIRWLHFFLAPPTLRQSLSSALFVRNLDFEHIVRGKKGTMATTEQSTNGNNNMIVYFVNNNGFPQTDGRKNAPT